MNIEEKVKPLIGKWTVENKWIPSDEWTEEEKEDIEKSLCFLSMDSYMQGHKDGIAYAFRSQWKDINKELPKNGERIFVLDIYDKVDLVYWNAQLENFGFRDIDDYIYSKSEVRYWHPTPSLPNN